MDLPLGDEEDDEDRGSRVTGRNDSTQPNATMTADTIPKGSYLIAYPNV
jgi:hypothetical protein